MADFINNLEAQYTDDNCIALSWSWPVGYTCLRIVFLHKLNSDDVSTADESSLISASDVCFRDEFLNRGNKYIYKLDPSTDTGLLRFRIFCCDNRGKNIEFDKSSAAAEINGIILRITYKVIVKKSGRNYQKVTLCVTPEAPVSAGILCYSVGGVRASYPIGINIPAQPTNIGPIVTAAGAAVVLDLTKQHEGEYEIYQN